MVTLYADPKPSGLRRFVYGLVKSLAILAALLALGLLSAYVAMTLSMEPFRVEVPRVVGLDSVAAGALLSEAGLNPRVVAEEFNTSIPKGHVTVQRPPGGTRIRYGSEVRLFVSRGTDQLEVPNVAGIPLAEAKRTLAEANLSLGAITRIHSDAHAREMVIAQDPPPGASATRGEAVRLMQSLGPWEETVTLPDLRGRELVAALNLLKELQLEVRLSFAQDASREGRVIGQEPPPGGKLKVGGQVRLTVGD